MKIISYKFYFGNVFEILQDVKLSYRRAVNNLPLYSLDLMFHFRKKNSDISKREK